MKVIRIISSLCLALLVLISSTSIAVGLHVCKGDIRDVALFQKAQACENHKEVPPCHRPVVPCCADESIVHDGDDFSLKTNHGPTGPSVLGVAPLPVVLAEIIPSAFGAQKHYSHYDPPLRYSDIIVRHRVLLI